VRDFHGTAVRIRELAMAERRSAASVNRRAARLTTAEPQLRLLGMGQLRSPVYRVSPHSAEVALAGLVLVLLPAVFAEQLLRAKKPSGGEGVNWFDRLAIGQDSLLAEWVSNVGTVLGVATPFVADWFDTRDERDAFRDDALVIGQALALNGALNTAVKYIVQRPLPETYAGVVQNRRGKPRGYRSFYSGHTSLLATALAAGCVTMRMRHGRLPLRWPWVLSAALTGVVGAARIFSGKHFPSDVLVGAPVGAAIGTAVPVLHARRGRLRRVVAKLRGVRRWRARGRRAL
jgi:membrane-associated phospholipid phosphatase